MFFRNVVMCWLFVVMCWFFGVEKYAILHFTNKGNGYTKYH